MSSRRDFLKKGIGTAIVASLVPKLSDFFVGDAHATVPTSGPGTVMLDLSAITYATLKDVGGSIVFTLPSPNTSVHLIIIRKDETTFSVLSSVCTHMGCIVGTYNQTIERIQCDCHGSQYDIDGVVMRGPAPRNLPSYSNIFDVETDILSITDATIITPPSGVDGPSEFTLSLAQNIPNPFQDHATIEFVLPYAGNITMSITDVGGTTIATLASGYFDAGTHVVQINGSLLSAGTYFYRLSSANGTLIRQMVKL